MNEKQKADRYTAQVLAANDQARAATVEWLKKLDPKLVFDLKWKLSTMASGDYDLRRWLNAVPVNGALAVIRLAHYGLLSIITDALKSGDLRYEDGQTSPGSTAAD